jgi:hypothetical protein
LLDFFNSTNDPKRTVLIECLSNQETISIISKKKGDFLLYLKEQSSHETNELNNFTTQIDFHNDLDEIESQSCENETNDMTNKENINVATENEGDGAKENEGDSKEFVYERTIKENINIAMENEGDGATENQGDNKEVVYDRKYREMLLEEQFQEIQEVNDKSVEDRHLPIYGFDDDIISEPMMDHTILVDHHIDVKTESTTEPTTKTDGVKEPPMNYNDFEEDSGKDDISSRTTS